MPKDKSNICKALFCNNPICNNCKEGIYCGLHALQQQTLGGVIRDWAK